MYALIKENKENGIQNMRLNYLLFIMILLWLL